jgi:two-component system sensor histidine kinase KdpD
MARLSAPGSRHPKRYQDVEELLESGIDVYTAVNIQHFESQVDVVAKITGIRVQETVPDTILERADEVQVIDIPLEELNQRLQEGKVYVPEQARRAVEHYFQRATRRAARATLTLVAEDGSELQLHEARISNRGGGERVMVCIVGNPYAAQL